MGTIEQSGKMQHTCSRGVTGVETNMSLYDDSDDGMVAWCDDDDDGRVAVV